MTDTIEEALPQPLSVFPQIHKECSEKKSSVSLRTIGISPIQISVSIVDDHFWHIDSKKQHIGENLWK